jgi:hypothetical protein|tara:strand:- start:774 stop:1010 length:237 start_codon:yes stop_codon:yes gene_type:complete
MDAKAADWEDSWDDDGGAIREAYPDVEWDALTGRYNTSVEVGGVVYKSLGFETAEEALNEALETRWYYGGDDDDDIDR